MSQPHPIQSDALMFITTNIKNKHPLFKNNAYAREATEMMYRIQEQPDHCHFLLFLDEHGFISKIMNRYKMGVSHSIGIGSIWQPRFHLRLPENAAAVLHYIHRNPVKAGIVDNPEDYPWSSASGKWDIVDLNVL